MARPATESSLFRRTVLAVGLAVGGSTVFFSACLLIASTALDRALPPPSADTAADTPAKVAETESAPTSATAHPRS